MSDFYLYKHNEQINKQNIDNSKCFGVKYVKIYKVLVKLLQHVRSFITLVSD